MFGQCKYKIHASSQPDENIFMVSLKLLNFLALLTKHGSLINKLF